MPANPATIDLLTGYYAAMAADDRTRLATYYADDMTLTFANSPTVKGRANVLATFAEVLDKVAALEHDLVNVWEQDGGVVVYESVAHWNLRDGTRISINACTVLTVVEGRFVDQRIYVDNAPVQAALG